MSLSQEVTASYQWHCHYHWIASCEVFSIYIESRFCGLNERKSSSSVFSLLFSYIIRGKKYSADKWSSSAIVEYTVAASVASTPCVVESWTKIPLYHIGGHHGDPVCSSSSIHCLKDLSGFTAHSYWTTASDKSLVIVLVLMWLHA